MRLLSITSSNNARIELAQKLIDHGAQLTDTNRVGRNALHYSTDKEVIKKFPSLINNKDCSGKFTINLFTTSITKT